MINKILIEKTLSLLDELIHKEIKLFKALGNRTKELKEKNVEQSKIRAVYESMAKILVELHEVEFRVRHLYPEYNGLIDLLKKEFNGPAKP